MRESPTGTVLSAVLGRHGPKPGSHEAEAKTKAFTKLEAEAEALTLINLEAEALVTKPKPGYLYYTHLQKKSTMA